MTRRGRLLCRVTAGEEIIVGGTDMERLCLDLAVAGRSLRAIRTAGDCWRVSLVGAPPAEGPALGREAGG